MEFSRNARTVRASARSLLVRIWSAAGRRSRWQHATFALCLIAVVGWVDRVTGEQLSISILYAAPVILLAWFVGRRAGIAGAFLCGAIRLALALEADSSAPTLIAVGNTDVELGFFLLCAFAFGTLKVALDREEELSRTSADEDDASPRAGAPLRLVEPGENKGVSRGGGVSPGSSSG